MVAPIVLIVVLPGVAKREQASSLLVSASSVSASRSPLSRAPWTVAG